MSTVPVAPARRPPSGRMIALVAAATVGGILLTVIVAIFWAKPNDAYAYWLAGERLAAGSPIYVEGEAAFAPYAYHYTPPLAQVFVPLTLAIPAMAYIVGYRAIELLVAWFLAGRRFLPLLALVAFVPVAVELSVENVHLLMALGIVLGLGRWPWLFAIGAIVKVSPGLGLVYLLLRRRWRDALIAAVVGAAVVVVSFVLAPDQWWRWLDTVSGRLGVTGNSLLPVPYAIRAAAGLGLTAVGGALGRRRGELLLVAGITIANPNLSMNGVAVLAAAVPIWRAGPAGLGSAREPAGVPVASTPDAAPPAQAQA